MTEQETFDALYGTMMDAIRAAHDQGVSFNAVASAMAAAYASLLLAVPNPADRALARRYMAQQVLEHLDEKEEWVQSSGEYVEPFTYCGVWPPTKDDTDHD